MNFKNYQALLDAKEDTPLATIQAIAQLNDYRYRELKAFFSLQKWRSLEKLGLTIIDESIASLQSLFFSSLINIPNPVSGNIPSANSFQNPSSFHSRQSINRFYEVTQERIGLVVKGLQAILYSNINIPSKDLPESFSSFVLDQTKQLIDDAKQQVDEYETTLEEFLMRIHAEFLLSIHHQEADDLLDIIYDLLEEAPYFIEQVVQTHTILTKSISILQQKRKMSMSERIGKVASDCNKLIRSMIGAIAGALQLALDIQANKSTDFIKQASKLSYDGVKLPDGKNTEIHKLEDKQEDDFVEIKGFVQTLEAFRTHDKNLVCKIKVFDPSSKKSAWCIAFYTHLAHSGIDIQSYVVVHGKVKKTSPLNDNGMVIHIDELHLSELKKESWKLALFDNGKAYYSVWPGGLNISWSLSPHVHDLKDKIIYKAGAAELFFQPLYRGKKFRQAREEKYQ